MTPLIVALMILTGCAGPVTTVKLYGTTGSRFEGFYTAHGVDIDVSGELPTTFHFKGEVPLDAFELKKAGLTNILILEIQTASTTNSLTAGPGTVGIKLERAGERYNLETF
jgi:hypothetical protein